MAVFNHQFLRRPPSLQRATNKRFREQRGKWRRCSSTKTIVYWSRTANEKMRSNCTRFSKCRSLCYRQYVHRGILISYSRCFYGFEVKSDSAYYFYKKFSEQMETRWLLIDPEVVSNDVMASYKRHLCCREFHLGNIRNHKQMYYYSNNGDLNYIIAVR